MNGWTVLGHALFLDQMERLVSAVEAERTEDPAAPPSGNAKLLAHLLDLAFEKIPGDPGSSAFRHGGTLGDDRKHWFRGKTGNGRYRLFYRYHSGARIIVLAWVNDEQSLRTYGAETDAYAVFASMLASGNPPDDWESLVKAARGKKNVARVKVLSQRRR
ncbi:MAG TPA: type II toxin-antitoxin system YhaV family toxin [Longimicrobiales bacterium]|nr:type II toxin-antitoxin system YhaV family toxin [Longimicrobiales bacterium]